MTTTQTIKLDDYEARRKATLSAALKAAITLYNSEVEEVNELLRAAAARADTAREKLNGVLGQVNEFATEIHGKIGRFVMAQDEEWQTGDVAELVEEWQRQWEAIDTTPVTGPGRLEIETVDTDNENLLDNVLNAPKAAR